MKKFELTDRAVAPNGTLLYQIRYLVNIEEMNIKVGDLGGFLESEKNLSHEGNCVVLDYATVQGDAIVKDNAVVKERSKIGKRATVSEDAVVGEDAEVTGDSVVKQYSHVGGQARIRGRAVINHHSVPHVDGTYHIDDKCVVDANAQVLKKAELHDEVYILGSSIVMDEVKLNGSIKVYGTSKIMASASIKGKAMITSSSIFGEAIINGDVIIEDSLISGTALIRGKCQIKSSQVFGSAKLADVSIYDKSLLRDNVLVVDSKLWNIQVKDSAKITDCVMQGNKVLIKEQADLIRVTMDNTVQCTVKGKAQLRDVVINESTNVRFDDEVDMRGIHNELVVACKKAVFSGYAKIYDLKEDCPILFNGQSIYVRDSATILGGFIFQDDVTIHDFVALENRSDIPVEYENVILNGDLKIEH